MIPNLSEVFKLNSHVIQYIHCMPTCNRYVCVSSKTETNSSTEWNSQAQYLEYCMHVQSMVYTYM